MKPYDKKMLDGLEGTGRVIAVMNSTLGNHIFDNIIEGFQADSRGRPKIYMKTVAHNMSVPWYTLKSFFADNT
eukprot:2549677-Heterocapsa_arctica.AAC.1